ncbi:MmgE/PrpD family protein [Paracoccus gahaiensis]|uniref:MmgE/PrpD family protein n=1 Tax=Paracoccus gahaiensis TaxID=1706839 RepID=A0A4U0R7I2_9RHOB|nr:MmgE/PrpD family protein [Paracoccus gahaiensis]TJZ90915.1 MmgE/PrpD family protein [Paracoccus gahaiensis]
MTSNPTLSPPARLAAHVAGWRDRPLTPAVEEAARSALLDWFATTLPGCHQPPATILAQALAHEAGPGEAVCYVDGRRMAPRLAALINGTASHIVEFDDIFRDGGYHPGSPTIAAALALAQHRGASLEDLHRAIVAGYEMGCRLSLAVQPSHYRFWHTTATIGTMGAAAAGALLLGCDAAQMGHAVALASSFAGGHQQNLQGAGMAKAIHPGHAAEAGLLAATAAAGGATAAANALDGPMGFAAATSESAGTWEAALEGLGDWTPITRMTVKNHGCCGHIFPAIDGLRVMRAKAGASAGDITAIEVQGYGATKSMCDNPDPTTAQAARFSLQYCLAADLILGAVRLSAFTPAALADPRIRALVPRISVAWDEDLAALYPRKRMARLRVRLSDGRVLDHLQKTRKGDPEDPLSAAERAAKFDELAATALSARDADALRQTILTGRDLPGALTLIQA